MTEHAQNGRVAAAIALFAAAILALCVLPAAATSRYNAQDVPSDICEISARRAAQATGVPLPVLRAISLTETGRKIDGRMRPWPWAVNMEGKGVWFESADAAAAYVARHHARGARSFDVGCFQLNFRWHGHRFSSWQHMMQPEANAQYAAQFLRELYEEKGNWPDAAGAYHSRTRELADRYKKRFGRFYTAQGKAPQTAYTRRSPADVLARPVNRYPLLTGADAEATGLGSLVRLDGPGGWHLGPAAKPLGTP